MFKHNVAIFKFVIAALIMCCTPFRAFTQNPITGWIFISHTQKLHSKWDLFLDAQVRSVYKFKDINTLLLRSAINYNLNGNSSFALGYASKNDWEQEDNGTRFHPEHRVYQQYLFKTEFGRLQFTGRARYEQRYIRSEDEFLFSQRSRAFVACQIPVFAKKDFKKGTYLNFQDEIFLNVFHKNRVNNSFFDQNRILGSLGYRWSDKIDTEVGYMWWYQRENEGDVSSNVIQLMITSNF
ncbi:DUF2490 domain-containing protein [Dyadobacter sp. CY327]|uniref:DUF2490 domain-containing protein n=1 Tax=Dyadobacter sp. CY327 TaxID=2907301 RepID=UPI001F2E9A2C|nr:DUF2490 domain-containing protein [Dyadobacter sp. CY327]MCE7073753.1 DUF2490 domain-containing protein [Dyadobacter sp. CY327]